MKISEIDIFNLKTGDKVYDYCNREVEIVDKSMDAIKVIIRFAPGCTQYKVFKNKAFGEEFTLFKSEKAKYATSNNNESSG